ncbi:MAG: response regulator, partial [Methyloprofundus sp.]|nr:response regulator [Methyloprofundus sp.]
INGFEVFEQLQKNNLNEMTKVIAVSANAMSADIDKGENIGFFGYFTKPIDQQQLLASMHKALNVKATH